MFLVSLFFAYSSYKLNTNGGDITSLSMFGPSIAEGTACTTVITYQNGTGTGTATSSGTGSSS